VRKNTILNHHTAPEQVANICQQEFNEVSPWSSTPPTSFKRHYADGRLATCQLQLTRETQQKQKKRWSLPAFKYLGFLLKKDGKIQGKMMNTNTINKENMLSLIVLCLNL